MTTYRIHCTLVNDLLLPTSGRKLKFPFLHSCFLPASSRHTADLAGDPPASAVKGKSHCETDEGGDAKAELLSLQLEKEHSLKTWRRLTLLMGSRR